MTRYSLLSFALALPLASTACGSDDSGDSETPTGEHYGYVVATVDPRATNKLDIDGNGSSENKLGDLVGLLTAGGFKVQEAIDEAVLTGAALLLVDVQTTSFSGASSAGVAFYLGDSATAMPAPCTDTTMITTCGKHLAGTGSFSIAASSPRDTQLPGPLTGGTLKAGPGELAIQIALTGAPIVVNLIGARAQISSVTADGIGKGVVGGAISLTELNNNVLPAIEGQLDAVVLRDCGPLAGRTGDTCNCTAGSTGLAVLRGTPPFDYSPADCDVSLDEIKNNTVVAPSLKSDVTVDGMPGISVGLGFTAKKATFTR
jgi:hypothetical protein